VKQEPFAYNVNHARIGSLKQPVLSNASFLLNENGSL